MFNKTKMDQLKHIINVFEKKKIYYSINVSPMLTDDKKISKKRKKIITNNKYILFNSWYTKHKHNTWPNSHSMWNLMKDNPSSRNFVGLFDFMERLCKSVETVTNNFDEKIVVDSKSIIDKNVVSASKKRSFSNALNQDDINKNNELRAKLYNEFYRVLSETYESATSTAPGTSFLYEYKITNASSKDFEKLSKLTVQNGIRTFKHTLETMNVDNAVVNVNNVKAKKRKLTSNNHVHPNIRKKQKLFAEKSEEMKSDYNEEDSVMSE
ncbi:39K [Urbanus proteus nucleopolyhedrovirus]|uniref:39K n=1 Tax=Urbanus proteus nucleopolyhedrovirus TaxID=1675866 RepID=A0A162GUH3_9ABAC|nr:39K [Urbanus proteus nucleopolyhedrovirus]AKR17343.2 39K [Urbanus proteus nucleopolyhedrovirus]